MTDTGRKKSQMTEEKNNLMDKKTLNKIKEICQEQDEDFFSL